MKKITCLFMIIAAVWMWTMAVSVNAPIGVIILLTIGLGVPSLNALSNLIGDNE